MCAYRICPTFSTRASWGKWIQIKSKDLFMHTATPSLLCFAVLNVVCTHMVHVRGPTLETRRKWEWQMVLFLRSVKQASTPRLCGSVPLYLSWWGKMGQVSYLTEGCNVKQTPACVVWMSFRVSGWKWWGSYKWWGGKLREGGRKDFFFKLPAGSYKNC